MNKLAYDYLRVSQETRKRMITQPPELVYRYLLQMHEVQVSNFNSIKHRLSQREQDQIETLLLKSELLLLRANSEFGDLSFKFHDL